MKIAQAEGKDWKKELHHFLLAYRSTPHSTTGATPSELLYGRNIRTKMPQLNTNHKTVDDTTVRDTDNERKQRSKHYVDQKRRAQLSDVEPGDTVILQHRRRKKLSTRYADVPYQVVDRFGNQLTLRSTDGVHYKRNSSHVHKYQNDTVEPVNSRFSTPEPDIQPSDEDSNSSCDDSEIVPVPVSVRPRRDRRPPKYLQDYIV